MHRHLHNNQQYVGNSWNTGYLLGNLYAGMGETDGMGYHVDDLQTMQTVESQLMTS